MDRLGVFTGRWHGAWVTVAANLSRMAYVCDILAQAVCCFGDWCVQISHCDFPILLRYRFGIVLPHLVYLSAYTINACGCRCFRRIYSYVVFGCVVVVCDGRVCYYADGKTDDKKQ